MSAELTDIAANLAAELPFLATENLMMAAAQQGADRQDVHEIIRRHSLEAARRVKTEAAKNDLLERLQQETVFQGLDLKQVTDPSTLTGRAPQQVDAFIEQMVTPIRDRYRDQLGYKSEAKV